MIDHSEYYKKYGLGPEKTFQLFINGEYRHPKSEKYFEVKDPSNGNVLAKFPISSKEDIDDAVRSARDAFEKWQNTSPSKRKKIMLKVSELCEKYEKDFAEIESLNVGSPISLTRRFSAASLSKNFEYFANWIERISGEVVPLTSSYPALDYTQKEPLGCIAAITSWNTPALFLGSKVAPALATGNSVILKPSEKAPLTAMKFAEVLQEADLPEGLVNIVTGLPETGSYLCSHPGIDGISFTGGTEIGKKVMAQASSNLKRVSLELGGKSPLIIFKDADLQKAVMMSCFGVFGLTGQMCIACSRIFVEESIYDEFLKGFVEFAKNMKVGDPLDPTTLVGPVITEEHLNRIMSYIEEGMKLGKCLTGGVRNLKYGNFIEPTVFVDLPHSCRVVQEEIFGPVVAIFPFKNEDEAIALANDTVYGLSGGIFTKDISRAHRVAKKIKAGQIWINTYSVLPTTAPFGGFKQSGFGKEGGKEALESFLNLKNIYIDLS